MANLVMKSEDTYPYIEATLESLQANGQFAAIDLTNAEKVTISAKHETGSGSFSGLCTFPEPKNGTVIYEQKNTDTTTTGVYEVEWVIKWDDGKVEHVPNESFLTIEVQAVVP